MGKFFVFLNKIGMSQKDQISLIQHIFDQFEVDWEEGDRENIKVSVQQPAIDYYKVNQEQIQAILLSKRSRRF